MIKRWTFASSLLVLALLCAFSVLRMGAANPTSGTINPTSSPLVWDGTAVGGTSNGEDTCVEGFNCDTFTLNVQDGDWTGKKIQIDVTWVVLAHDYDVYIHKGSDPNTGPLIDSSTGGPPSTSERADINPAIDGTGIFTVRVVYFAATAGDQYHAVATIVGGETPPPPPPPKSDNWSIVYHGTCCEGNLSAAGDNTYVLLPVLVTGNKIKRSSDGGQTWVQKYPPVDASVPYGIEGDMQAFGDDVIFFGTELADVVVAHSDDAGETFTVVHVPVTSAGNDQTWSYLGPFGDLNPLGPLPSNEPYVLAGWFRIGSAVIFSFDGGLTWPIQTPLVGNNGSGPEHVVCHASAANPPGVDPGDTRVTNPLFARQKAGRHGAWGTDRKFHWSETVEGTLYVCQTGDFGANWTGTKHPVAPGPGEDFVVTHSAFDNNGTLYVVHGDKLYVSLNQGKTFAYTHTLPRYGSASRGDTGSSQFFVVDCGTIHLAVLEDAGQGDAYVYYLRGANVDSATPVWEEELVDIVGNVRLDFMQIVLNGNGVPTISYTTPTQEVTTASRLAGATSCVLPASAVSRKVHGGNPALTFDVPLPLLGEAGIEGRSGGPNGEHTVVVTFSGAVTIPPGSVTVEAPAGGSVSNVAVNGAVVTISLSGVQNAQVITINLNGITVEGTTGDLAIPMGVLLGDVNASRVVSGADVNLVKGQQSKPVTSANFRSDVNVSGVISGADVNVVKGAQSTSLP